MPQSLWDESPMHSAFGKSDDESIGGCVDFRGVLQSIHNSAQCRPCMCNPKRFYRKGIDHETHDSWHDVSAIGGSFSRYEILQNTTSGDCGRSCACDLAGVVWAGHWKFLRQCAG